MCGAVASRLRLCTLGCLMTELTHRWRMRQRIGISKELGQPPVSLFDRVYQMIFCIFRPDAPPPLDARYILRFVHLLCLHFQLFIFVRSKICRPETVESLFIAYRLTGDNIYRKWGWRIFQAIEKHCKVETGGYAAVLNVEELPVTLEDKMETFLLVRFCFLARC